MRPSNFNPIKIGFTLLSVGGTEIDPDFRAPSGRPEWNEEVLVDGCIKYFDKDKLRQTPGGDQPKADGHVMIWVDDLTEAGISPRKGDRITSVAGQEVNFMIVDVIPRVHISGVPQVKIFEFEKRTTQ